MNRRDGIRTLELRITRQKGRLQVALHVRGESAEVLERATAYEDTVPLAMARAGQWLFNLRTQGQAALEAGEARRRSDKGGRP